MRTYGILLVDTSWSNDDLVRIDKATYLRHSDHLITGAQALIYVRAPVDAVVAEAEVTGDIIESETEPPDLYFNPPTPSNLRLEREIEAETTAPPATTASQEMAKTYSVPLNLTRRKGRTPPIPLNRLREILGSDFSVFDETWIRLSADQYAQIVAVWDKAD